MPIIPDPGVRGSLLVPRGFIPLVGSEEETRPEAPEPEPVAPTLADRVTGLFAGSDAGPGAVIFPGIGPVGGQASQSQLANQAAFRQSNTIVSAISRMMDTWGVSNELVDPNYSPWTDVVGTPYEDYYKNVFSYSNNPQYTAALKRSIDRQEADRRMVAANGASGIVAGIVAGVIDPTILIPVGGEITLASKGVWNLGRGTLQGIRAGGIGTAAYEAGLHASQETRTFEESVTNVSTGVVLGAVIGGTIAGALTRTQRVASEAALEKLANEPIPGSLGAAAPHYFSIDDLTINGTISRNIASGMAYSPNLRGNFRESPLARRTYQEIATNTLQQQMHTEGLSLGPSVETNINVSLAETIGQALEAHPNIFADAKKQFGMSADHFDQAVGRAMRRGDVGENEYVTKAAQMWRAKVIEPLKQQGIDLELLPEDVKVTEAASYFSRMYNTDKMVARKPEFIAVTQEHFHGVLQEQYQKAVGTLGARKADLLEEAEILKMPPKLRAKKIAELQGLEQTKKVEKLIARLSETDKEKIAARIEELNAKVRELERKFHDTWETKRLGENIDINNPEAVPDFSAHAKDMSQEVYDSIVGNDYGSSSVDPKFHLAAKSGPLKERTFHIPDELIEPFLEDNVVTVMSKFARRMAAQLEIARKFPGDPLLQNRFKEIQREYDALINAAGTEAERTKLQKDMKGAFRDLRALVEIHRGSYLAKENASSYGRVVRGTMLFNYIRSMGGAALPSLQDLYNPAIFHGFGKVMDIGVPALMKAVTKGGGLIKEAKHAGVAERLAHQRLLTLTEIGDPYANGTAVERWLEQGSHVASKWNGLNMLTDFEKAFDAIIVQDRMNSALLAGAKASKKDTTWLAQSGITSSMKSKIAKYLEKYGTEEDGIKVANTELWDDFDAVRAYRAAINFNVNADVVTRGIGDVPLAAYTPTGKAWLQFKTFSLAAHQRTFLRSMQLGPAQFLSGLIGLTTIGMFITYLKAMRGGAENFERFKKSAENPGYWVGEGLDATGLFTIPIELSNTVEKATLRAGYPVNPIKTPIMLAGRTFVPDAQIAPNSQRFANQGVLTSALGPTAGLIEDIPVAAGAGIDKARGEELTRSQKNAANRVVPFQSYLGMKELLQVMQENSSYVDNE